MGVAMSLDPLLAAALHDRCGYSDAPGAEEVQTKCKHAPHRPAPKNPPA